MCNTDSRAMADGLVLYYMVGNLVMSKFEGKICGPL